MTSWFQSDAVKLRALTPLTTSGAISAPGTTDVMPCHAICKSITPCRLNVWMLMFEARPACQSAIALRTRLTIAAPAEVDAMMSDVITQSILCSYCRAHADGACSISHQVQVDPPWL